MHLSLRGPDGQGEGPRLKLFVLVRGPGASRRLETDVWLPVYRWLPAVLSTTNEEQLALDTMQSVWLQAIETWLRSHGVQSDDEYAWLSGTSFMRVDWRRVPS